MTFKYNLIDEKWIPCVNTQGEVRKLSLTELLTGSENWKDLADPYPIVNAALLRFLTALLMDIFRPKDKADFFALSTGEFPENKVKGYLAKYHERFDLFDEERPFFQADDNRVRPKPVLKMMHHIASGNNATLFDHHTESSGLSLTADEAARYLIAIQSFGLGGLSGIPDKFTNAPAVKGINFFIKGDNLHDTLFLNLFAYREDKAGGIPNRVEDAPAWSMVDPLMPRTTPNGLLDYLTWQNRRIRLIPEEEAQEVVIRQMTEGPGLRLNDEFISGNTTRDPFHFYYQGKTAILPLKFSENRVLWRDSAALFNYEKTDENDLLAPENLLHLKYLVNEEIIADKNYQLSALGMAADKAKVLFYRQEELPLPAIYLEDYELVKVLSGLLDKAEDTSRKLYGAISRFAGLAVDGSDTKDGKESVKKLSPDAEKLRDHLGAERFFWVEAQTGFLNLLLDLPEQEEIAAMQWKIHLYQAAFTAHDNAITLAGDSVRFAEAQVKSEQQLRYTLSDLIKREEVTT